MIQARTTSLIGFAIGLAITAALPSTRLAAEPSKDQCLDAHSRGQDAKDSGKLSLARKLFLTCAQPSCPTLVQGDCARFADDLSRQLSSLTFIARDARGADLPDTAVYVDDILLLTRLDDGKPHEIDPGRHTVRFSSGGKDQTVTLVVGTGEQGRAVVATFAAINPLPSGSPGNAMAAEDAASRQPTTTTVHPLGAKLAMAGGLALTAGGVVLYATASLPANCSASKNTCAAPPGDPVFAKASSAMKRRNAGLFVGGLGAAALVGGAVWYFTSASTETEGGAKVVTPVVSTTSVGVALSGRF